MELNSNLPESKPTVADKGRGNSIYFEKAYWQVMAQIEAPREAINTLLPLLYDSFEAGVANNGRNRVEQLLPQGSLCWPEYERQIPGIRKQEYEGIKAHLAKIDYEAVASVTNYDTLRKVGQEVLNRKITTIRRKQQAEELIAEIKNQRLEMEALNTLRQALLEKHEKQFNRVMSLQEEYAEMVKMLVNRIWRLASSLWQYQRILRSKEQYPYLRIFVGNENKAKPECVALERKVLRLDDPFWNNGLPPCERLDCLCSVFQEDEKSIKRKGLIIDKT